MATIVRQEQDELKQKVRGRLEEYVIMRTRGYHNNPRSHLYAHPLPGGCGSGTHDSSSSDGDLHVTKETWFCHACKRGGDIFDFYAEEHGLNVKNDFPEILEGLRDALGIPIPSLIESKRSRSGDYVTVEDIDVDDMFRIDINDPEESDPTTENEDVKEKERLKAISDFESQISGSPGEKYLHDRGFSDSIIKKYRLGYNPNNLRDRQYPETIVIPYPGTSYYTQRLMYKEGRDKYINLSEQEYPNKPEFIIHEGKSGIFFLTEGQLDALSLRQAGALDIIATHYKSKLNDLLDSDFSNEIKGVVIVADRDPDDKRDKDGKTPGQRTADEMSEVLSSHGIKNIIVYPPEGYKDSNDILKDRQEKLTDLLKEWGSQLIEVINKPADDDLQTVNLQSYIAGNGFQNDLDYFQKYRDRKTGFSKIDEYLTLYPGLGALTGATSLGKTSFVVQLADQLAERGETVIYFSLEQTPVEITTKILSRRLYARNPFSKINNLDIKNGATSEDLEAVKRAYFEVSSRFNIIRSNFTTTVDDVVSYVRKFIEKTNIRPVVFIDYLQILGAPEGSRFDDRQRIDDAVKKLKLLSVDQQIFILMISNMARSTYREKLGEDSFKESGLIEYTADYLFGLQLSVLEDDDFYQTEGSRGGKKETLKSEKQDKIDEASEAMPKEVVFKSMKNRNGRKVFRAFFKYHPDFDYFEEDLRSPHEKLPDGYKNGSKQVPFLTV